MAKSAVCFPPACLPLPELPPSALPPSPSALLGTWHPVSPHLCLLPSPNSASISLSPLTLPLFPLPLPERDNAQVQHIPWVWPLELLLFWGFLAPRLCDFLPQQALQRGQVERPQAIISMPVHWADTPHPSPSLPESWGQPEPPMVPGAPGESCPPVGQCVAVLLSPIPVSEPVAGPGSGVWPLLNLTEPLPHLGRQGLSQQSP